MSIPMMLPAVSVPTRTAGQGSAGVPGSAAFASLLETLTSPTGQPAAGDGPVADDGAAATPPTSREEDPTAVLLPAPEGLPRMAGHPLESAAVADPGAADPAAEVPAAVATDEVADGQGVDTAALEAGIDTAVIGPAHAPARAGSERPAAAMTAASHAPTLSPAALQRSDVEERAPAAHGTAAAPLGGMAAPASALGQAARAPTPVDETAQRVPSTPIAALTGDGPTAPSQLQPTPGTAAAAAPAAPAHPAPAAPLARQVGPELTALRTAPAGEHTLTLSITPDELGPVTVKAHIGSDGIRIELFAPELGRDALRAILPDLRRDLAGGGLPHATLDLATDQREHGGAGDPRAGRRPHDQPPGRGGTGDRFADAGASPLTGHVPAGATSLDILL
ncbi:flagellar hook-length control protein FliK [Pseudactinotalea terrae]|uniref:flagellar hook-length control protein FliK n=1 Tax=Pseudactinotalea terrae TaxID=1743262 RepID=UPI0012E109AD|nr:flagellar hook-length control protein FliK [Pseudactinotalea terrae]